ncbi:DUF4179 domain-containing protein [Neobacillus kokaensis]|uniref:DUF4179 domain-containing protein n=1 Tax=Neobacillus kokaensis TaxID=2759023 RepID=A0ABQ3N5V6_9BACI|nr:DUF4179 domain-containing protein [Neobacillus kokaensis]GHH99451.1 hypothetical protein AM1BK_29940 [Neobacillus kokaensis]
MDNKAGKRAIDKIVVPKEKVLNAIDTGLKMAGQGEKTKKKKVFAGSAAAVALLGITVTSGSINSTMNKVLTNAPLIGLVFQEFDDSIGIKLAKHTAKTHMS